CIWSETAVPYLSIEFNGNSKFSFLQDFINNSKVPLLTGYSFIRIVPKGEHAAATAKPLPFDSTTMYEAYNAALIIHPKSIDSSSPEIYKKMKLTPFSERFPFVDYLSFAKSWFEWGVGISSWTIGTRQFPLKLRREYDTVKIGSII
ncbi:MAG: apolipoprotein N-acyltransferase, partial [Bacteroidota bacterium]|nr:apolipoprotein N-acyltransferase [Bacteroidota bacterium]